MTLRHFPPLLFLIAAPLLAQVPPPPALPQPTAPATESFKEVSPGILQLGLVTLQPKQRLIKIPTLVSMQDGVVKYLLVGQNGKTSESLLTTQADPLHVHLAMLYLGFKEPSAPTPTPQKPDLSNTNITVQVTLHWVAQGKKQQAPAENWLLNNKNQEPMAAGDWIYNGSKTVNGVFMAQQEKCFISLVADSQALLNTLNSPRPETGSEAFWKTRSDIVPPAGTPVEVQLHWPEIQMANLPPPPNEPLTSQPGGTPPPPSSSPSESALR